MILHFEQNKMAKNGRDWNPYKFFLASSLVSDDMDTCSGTEPSWLSVLEAGLDAPLLFFLYVFE